ncbi:MAG: hypothetical protein M3Q97_05085 [Bacteroidota bacterium]|nr:hypothetical protein [Bacteroidota bacterium]
MNTAILILQILWLLKKKKWNSVIDRAESLRSYLYRNLNHRVSERTILFIKMLLQLDKSDFEVETWNSRTKSLLNKMGAYVQLYKPEESRIEVVSYEQLHSFILSCLTQGKRNPWRNKERERLPVINRKPLSGS